MESDIEIKHRLSGKILFSLKAKSLKLCLESAVEECADLSGADMAGADLRRADLVDADLADADLKGADLADADLRLADLRRADLAGADLSGAKLTGADLSGADLRDANLTGADLRDADLADADLKGADLRDADLAGADLTGANLRDADLRDANLTGADLRRADLAGVYLAGTENISKFLTTPICILQDQIGKIRAYKLTTRDGTGPYYPDIKYEIGETYSVKNANCDEREQCAEGISLATLDWCIKEWKKGYRIFVAEFSNKDIACIPIGSDGKFRVHRCKIVAEKDLKELGLYLIDDIICAIGRSK